MFFLQKSNDSFQFLKTSGYHHVILFNQIQTREFSGMSETREIFTQRRKGVSQKEVRVKQHNEERKGKRHDLLLKRRIPTDVESDEEPEESVKSTPLEEKAGPAKSTAWDKSDQRRQQLLEWQAKRKAMKAEGAKSKKVVVPGSKQPVLTLIPVPNILAPQPATDVGDATKEIDSTHTNHSAGSNTQQQNVSTAKRVTRSQKGAAEKPTVAPVPPKSLRANAGSDRKPATAKQKVSTPEEKGVPKATRKGQTDTTTKENLVDKRALGPAKGKDKDTLEKKETVLEKKIVVKKVGVGVVEKKKDVVEKKVGVVERKRGGVEKMVDVAEKKGKVASKTTVAGGKGKPGNATEKKQPRTKLKKEHVESNTTPQAESTTLSYADSSDTTHVKSPCNDSIEESSSIRASTQDENQAPDVAWVPGYRATPKSKLPTNFRDAFGESPLHSFSPFRFTGAKTPRGTQEQGKYEFTFSKTLPSNAQDFVAGMGVESSDMESDSLMEQEGAGDECGDERVNEEWAGGKCGKESVRKKSTEDGNKVVCVVNVHKVKSIEGGHKESVEDPSKKDDGSIEKSGDEGQRLVNGSMKDRVENGHARSKAEDGDHIEEKLNKEEAEIAFFRKLHSDVVEKLTSLCQLWEQKSPTLSIPEERQEEGEIFSYMQNPYCKSTC